MQWNINNVTNTDIQQQQQHKHAQRGAWSMRYGGSHNSRVERGGNMAINCFSLHVFILHVHGMCLRWSFGLNVVYVKEVSHPALRNYRTNRLKKKSLYQSAFYEYSTQEQNLYW